MGDLAAEGPGSCCNVCVVRGGTNKEGSDMRTGKAKFRVWEGQVSLFLFHWTKSMLRVLC